MNSRRDFIKKAGIVGALGPISTLGFNSFASNQLSTDEKIEKVWPNGVRLIISISMQFEAGGEPDGAPSPFPNNMKPGFKDFPSSSWYAYGYKEGIPRMLDNWDKFGVKVTSHMVGSAVNRNPGIAKEIVERGHEASGHGFDWAPQYDMDYQTEKKFISEGAKAIFNATGTTIKGYNASFLRRSENTVNILQELGFTYHIDDISRDEPFIIKANNADFAVVPYTARCNDIVLIETRNFSTDQFINQVKSEFDILYQESAYKRRQLSIAFHDRIGGTPQMVKATAELLTYMKKHKGIMFMRKDDIATMILNDPSAIRE